MKCKGIKVLATVLAFMLAASTWDFNIQNVYGSMENTVKSESVQNTVLDSGHDAQVIVDKSTNAFRATPVIGK